MSLYDDLYTANERLVAIVADGKHLNTEDEVANLCSVIGRARELIKEVIAADELADAGLIEEACTFISRALEAAA